LKTPEVKTSLQLFIPPCQRFTRRAVGSEGQLPTGSPADVFLPGQHHLANDKSKGGGFNLSDPTITQALRTAGPVGLPQGMLTPRTTDLGKQFLAFIS
jgi:hypothetical protein